MEKSILDGKTNAEQAKQPEHTNSSVTKVNSRFSPVGEMGQKYLASGTSLSMRLWENEETADFKPVSVREYETVGYVLEGKAELKLEGQTLILEAGDSWTVPKGAKHTYRILETFTAVEATHPPAEVKHRDGLSHSESISTH